MVASTLTKNVRPDVAVPDDAARSFSAPSETDDVMDISEDKIAVYDDVVARFGTATELSLREQVALALLYKGLTLGHTMAAITAYDELLARFRTAPELSLRENVATALLNKGDALNGLAL